MGFRVGRLVGVEVGLRHSGQQLGSRVGVYGSGAVGWLSFYVSAFGRRDGF